MNRLLSTAAAGLACLFTAQAEAANRRLPRPEPRIVTTITTNGVTERLPRCTARDGTRVRYVATDEGADGSPSAYRVPRGLPRNHPILRELEADGLPTRPGSYISFDPAFFAGMTRAQRALVLAHECGHHRLGHVESEDGSRRQSHRFEHEADCEAVRILRREFGMTQAEVTEAISVLRHAGPANDTHPGSRARIRYSMGCLSR